MNREFRLKVLNRRLMIAAGCFFVLIASSFLLFLVLENSGNGFWPVVVVFLFFGGIGALIFREGLRWRLTVDDYGIRLRTALGERYAALDEIAGFRQTGKGRLVIRLRAGRRPLAFTLPSVEDSALLLDWLSRTLPDLDKADYEAEQAALLADERQGADEAARLARYRLYRRAATLLTIAAAVVLGFSAIPALRTSPRIIYLAALLPFAGCGLLVWSKGFIGLDARKNSDRPALLFAMVLATASVVIVGCLGHSMIEVRPLFPWLGGLAALYFLPYLVVCLYYRRHNPRLVSSSIVIALLMACGCAVGLARFLNFNLDEGALTPYSATVTEHWETSGKGSHYHIKFSAEGPLEKPQQEDVSREDFNRLQVGSPVLVVTGKGRLGAAWYVMVSGEQ